MAERSNRAGPPPRLCRKRLLNPPFPMPPTKLQRIHSEPSASKRFFRRPPGSNQRRLQRLQVRRQQRQIQHPQPHVHTLMQDARQEAPREQIQQQLHLFLANGQPAGYSSKFVELDLASQMLLLNIEDQVHKYKFESELIDNALAVRAEESCELPVDILEDIKQDLETIKHRNYLTMVELKKMDALANKLFTVADAMASKFEMVKAHYPYRGPGPAERPSKYFKEKCERQFQLFDEIVKVLNEVENLMVLPKRPESSPEALTTVVENVHDYFMFVAAKVEKIHTFVGNQKDLVKKSITVSYEKCDPVAADGMEIIKQAMLKSWIILADSTSPAEFLELQKLSSLIRQQNVKCSDDFVKVFIETLVECVQSKVVPLMVDRICLTDMSRVLDRYARMVKYTSEFFGPLEKEKFSLLEEKAMTIFFSQVMISDSRVIDAVLTAIREERDGYTMDSNALLTVINGICHSEMKSVIQTAVLHETEQYYRKKSSEWIVQYRLNDYFSKVRDAAEKESTKMLNYLCLTASEISDLCIKAVTMPMMETAERHSGKSIYVAAPEPSKGA